MPRPQLSGTIAYPRTSQPQFLTARQVGRAYGFPLDSATGKGYVGGFIELGGGYDLGDIQGYFESARLPQPSFTAVGVGEGSNSPTGDPDGPDGEVQSDMIVAGSVAPSADYRVYFGGNTLEDFYQALDQATQECDGVSVSWGSPEFTWPRDAANAFELTISAARKAGKPVFVAAGDRGADDGTNRKVADFPASAPSSISCGGTRLYVNSDGTRRSEVTWDDNPTTSATGGGVSKIFPGRQEPDVAGNADPDTGYLLSIDGESTVIGGTSLVAPLWLGMHALITEATNHAKFDLMSIVATHPGVCFDITIGDNGGFRAGPGRDEVSGYGVPDAGRLISAIRSLTSTATPPA